VPVLLKILNLVYQNFPKLCLDKAKLTSHHKSYCKSSCKVNVFI